MRKSMVVALCLFVIAVSTTSAFAAGGYIGIGAGGSFFHDADLTVTGVGTVDAEYDTGYGFLVKIGGQLNPNFRLEGEFGYREADLDTLSGPGGSVSVSGWNLNVMSFMLNGYYDFKTQSTVTPFVGVGIGMLKGELEVEGFSEDDTVPGYQLMAGISVAANPNVSFDFSYCYQGAASDFEKEGIELSYKSSNLFAGLRFNF